MVRLFSRPSTDSVSVVASLEIVSVLVEIVTLDAAPEGDLWDGVCMSVNGAPGDRELYRPPADDNSYEARAGPLVPY